MSQPIILQRYHEYVCWIGSVRDSRRPAGQAEAARDFEGGRAP